MGFSETILADQAQYPVHPAIFSKEQISGGILNRV
jgi:hypothetical protein